MSQAGLTMSASSMSPDSFLYEQCGRTVHTRKKHAADSVCTTVFCTTYLQCEHGLSRTRRIVADGRSVVDKRVTP